MQVSTESLTPEMYLIAACNEFDNTGNGVQHADVADISQGAQHAEGLGQDKPYPAESLHNPTRCQLVMLGFVPCSSNKKKSMA